MTPDIDLTKTGLILRVRVLWQNTSCGTRHLFQPVWQITDDDSIFNTHETPRSLRCLDV